MSAISSKLQQFIEARSSNGWIVRLQLQPGKIPEAPSRFLIAPSPGYLETEAGPVPIGEVEAVLIDKVENRYVGKLVPDKRYDHTKNIITLLDGLQIPFLLQADHIVVRVSDII